MIRKTLVSVGTVLFSCACLAGIPLPVERSAAPDLQHALKNRLLAVEAADERLVTVGRRGHILISDDAGESWLQKASPVASDLVASHFLDARLGWAVGHDGVVLKTEDGGETWSKVLDGAAAAALIGEFRQGPVELSEDAAFEYERFEMEGGDKPFLTVHFSDPQHGVVLGAFNYAFRTEDGGNTWIPFSHQIDNPMGFHLYAAFEHQGVLHVAGEKGLLLRWDAESERLTALESPYEGSWFGGISLGDQILLFGLRGSVWVGSPDSGWTKVQPGTEDSFNNATVLDDGAALLVAQSGRIFRIERQGNGFSSAELPVSGGMPVYDLEVKGDHLVVVGARGVRQLSLQNDE